MNKKSMSFLLIIGLFLAFITVAAAVKSPEDEMPKIHNERIKLKNTRNTILEQCTVLKGIDQNNYNECKRITNGWYEAGIHLLMNDPDTYFAQKQQRNLRN
jgi:hypothetical protein